MLRRALLTSAVVLVTMPALAANYTTNPIMQKDEISAWEHSPFVWNGDLYRIGFKRSWTGWADHALVVERYDGYWEKIAETPWDLALGCVLVDNGQIYVFGTTDTRSNGNSIKRLTLDPTTWTLSGELHIFTAPWNLRVFNTSVTKGPDKYVMVYETTEGIGFSIRFLQSTQGTNWSAIGTLCHGSFYSACPTIHYAENGWYMVTYMWNNSGTFETAIGRTNNFLGIQTFQGNGNYTPYQQLLSPDPMEGNNNSDVDFCEWNGKVYFTYLTGNQVNWAIPNDAWYEGTLLDFYHEWW